VLTVHQFDGDLAKRAIEVNRRLLNHSLLYQTLTPAMLCEFLDAALNVGLVIHFIVVGGCL
jgi:hypothetical protein